MIEKNKARIGDGQSRGRTESSRPARARRGSISADQIVAGAMALAARDGIDALSMPRLAHHLGIGVTSIYWYFRTKNELIEALTVVAAQTFHALIHPAGDLAWDDALFEAFTRLRAGMRADAVSCDLLFMHGGRASEAALGHMWPGTEDAIARMVAAGFTPQEALRNIVILSLFTRGCIVLERQMLRDGIAADVATPVPASFPLFTRALEGQNTRGVSDRAYRDQLAQIIEGMALVLRARQDAASNDRKERG